jgi:hypothetical protein
MALDRIDSALYRDRLQAIWDLHPGRYTALAMVLLLEALRMSLEQLREKVGVGAWPIDESQQAFALRGWDKDFAAWSKRVGVYSDDIPPCWEGEGSECWADPPLTMVEYITINVADPILKGDWPEDFYIGVPIGTMADASQGASLWNQLIEVANLQSELTDLSSHLGEWLLYVERELSASAPGEPATLHDDVVAAAARIKDAAGDLAATAGRGFMIGAIAVATVIGGIVVWKVSRK